MNDRSKPAGHPALIALAFVLFFAGLLAWMWIGDWRLAVTGLALGLLSAILGNTKLRP